MGVEVGLSLGWGPRGSWQPSPFESLSLASCQVPAPPPPLNHCHLSSEQGNQAVGFSFLLRIPETVVSHLVTGAPQSCSWSVAWEQVLPGLCHIALQPPSSC